MSVHALYVTAAYAITAIVLAGLIGWILIDQQARKRDLAELEAAGVRRRSDKSGGEKPAKDKGAKS
jgi:heme exporter protein D